MADLVYLASFVGFLKSLLMVLVVLFAIFLIVVVLLQEGKGGGLSGAFGGAGAETFGVQTGTVNKFTSWVAGIFMGLAILYAAIKPPSANSSVFDQPEAPAPANPGASGKTPAKPAEKGAAEKGTTGKSAPQKSTTGEKSKTGG